MKKSSKKKPTWSDLKRQLAELDRPALLGLIQDLYAASVSDTLKAELGAMARQFQSEDEWLQGVRAHLEAIIEDPAEYVDYWDLENEEGVTTFMIGSCATEFCSRVDKILAVPMNKRGARAW